MAQDQWDAASSADALYTDFEATVTRAAATVVPGDYVLALAECPICKTALFRSAAPDAGQKSVEYDVFPEASARELHAGLTESRPLCPSCKGPAGESTLRNLYVARVAPYWPDVLWLNFEWQGSGWKRPEYFVFTPPDRYDTLGNNPSNEQVAKEWGRAAHPAVALIAAYRAVIDNEPIAVRWVTPECAFVAYDATKSPSEQQVFAAVNQQGVPPPYRGQKWRPGQYPRFLERLGADKAVRRMVGARLVGVQLVVSEPALRTRVAQWGRATASGVTADLEGRVTVARTSGRKHASLEDFAGQLAEEGLTPDDVLYSMGARENGMVPPARRTRGAAFHEPPPVQPPAARAAVAVPTTAPPAPPPLVPAAAPASAYAAGRLPGRVRLCAACGRQAHLVRRLFDSPRLDGLYKPKPVIFEKKLVHCMALMITCGEHLRPVTAVDLAQWGITQNGALTEVFEWMPFDELGAWRRVHYSKSHQPIVGLVGPFISSVVASDLWLEQAIRATGVDLGNPVKVEAVGENVLVFRPPKQVDLEKVGRDLRKYSKDSGLPEPMIAFNITKKFVRQPNAVGRIIIRGTI